MKVLVVDDDPRLREALEVGVQLQWEDCSRSTRLADGCGPSGPHLVWHTLIFPTPSRLIACAQRRARCSQDGYAPIARR